MASTEQSRCASDSAQWRAEWTLSTGPPHRVVLGQNTPWARETQGAGRPDIHSSVTAHASCKPQGVSQGARADRETQGRAGGSMDRAGAELCFPFLGQRGPAETKGTNSVTKPLLGQAPLRTQAPQRCSTVSISRGVCMLRDH